MGKAPYAKQVANNKHLQELNGTVPDILQPNNVEAEEATIGALLLDNGESIDFINFLRPQDFYVERHRWIFEAIAELRKKNTKADLITMYDKLERKKQLEEIGGIVYLTELINRTPSSMNLVYYAQIVHRTGVLREIIAAAGEMARLAYDTNLELEEVRAEVQRIISPVLISTEDTVKHVSKSVDAVMDNVEERRKNPGKILGISTGLRDLDKLILGFEKGDFIILAGRPGMGKTAFALSLALHAAKVEKMKPGILSLEMPDSQLAERLISAEAGIDSQRLRLGNLKENEWPQFLDACRRVAGTDIYIDDTMTTPSALRSRAVRMILEYGVNFLLVDYIQLVGADDLNGRGDNRQQEVSYVSRTLKKIARDMNIPVLALSQLNRALEARKDKRPILSDLRDSGSLEQDCDIALFLYRAEVYDPDTEFPNIAEIGIGKQRRGPTGIVSTYFRKHLTQFVDLEVRSTPLEST